MNEVYAIFTVNRDIINFTNDLMEICSSKEDAMEGIVEIASNFEDSLRDNYYSDAYDEPTLAVKKVEAYHQQGNFCRTGHVGLHSVRT